MAFAVIYIVTVIIIFKGGYNINQDNYKDFGSSLAIILPLHLFMIYCAFYGGYFIAKLIATVASGRIVKIDDYLGTFFLIAVLPIGIWWIQPKIRRIFSANSI